MTPDMQSAPATAHSANGEDDATTIQSDATTATLERPEASAVEGCGGYHYRRARALAIAAALLEYWRFNERELSITRASVRKLDDIGGKAFELALEWTAPSRECADPLWFRAFTSEAGLASIVAARMHGWMPDEYIELASAAFAAVVFGKLLVRKGGRHA